MTLGSHRGAGLCLLLLLALGSAGAEAVTIALQADPKERDFATIELRGMESRVLRALAEKGIEPQEWARVFSTVPNSAADGSLPMLGTWEIDAGLVRFRPRFALVAGLDYRSRFDPRAIEDLLGAAFDMPGGIVEAILQMPPSGESRSPEVIGIFPSAELLPANLLRFYVHFSEPMHARNVARHAHLQHLVDDEERVIEDALVSIPDGLWDREGKRWTLLIHPGRIKRGVGPRLFDGPVLREGETYRLVIDKDLESRAGRAMAANHVREFLVGPADRRIPDPHAWKLRHPRLPTSVLRVEFGEALDSALARRWIRVFRRDEDQELAGCFSLGPDESSWSFKPQQPWQSGEYRLEIAAGIEDLAGNTPMRLFDERDHGGSESPALGGTLELRWTLVLENESERLD